MCGVKPLKPEEMLVDGEPLATEPTELEGVLETEIFSVLPKALPCDDKYPVLVYLGDDADGPVSNGCRLIHTVWKSQHLLFFVAESSVSEVKDYHEWIIQQFFPGCTRGMLSGLLAPRSLSIVNPGSFVFLLGVEAWQFAVFSTPGKTLDDTRATKRSVDLATLPPLYEYGRCRSIQSLRVTIKQADPVPAGSGSDLMEAEDMEGVGKGSETEHLSESEAKRKEKRARRKMRSKVKAAAARRICDGGQPLLKLARDRMQASQEASQRSAYPTTVSSEGTGRRVLVQSTGDGTSFDLVSAENGSKSLAEGSSKTARTSEGGSFCDVEDLHLCSKPGECQQASCSCSAREAAGGGGEAPAQPPAAALPAPPPPAGADPETESEGVLGPCPPSTTGEPQGLRVETGSTNSELAEGDVKIVLECGDCAELGTCERRGAILSVLKEYPIGSDGRCSFVYASDHGGSEDSAARRAIQMLAGTFRSRAPPHASAPPLRLQNSFARSHSVPVPCPGSEASSSAEEAGSDWGAVAGREAVRRTEKLQQTALLKDRQIRQLQAALAAAQRSGEVAAAEAAWQQDRARAEAERALRLEESNQALLHELEGTKHQAQQAAHKYHALESSLVRYATILQQVNHYFSKQNLMTDKFLLSLMDSNGFLPLASLVAFPRMQQVGCSVEELRWIMQYCPHLEVDHRHSSVRSKHMPRTPRPATLAPGPPHTPGPAAVSP